MDNNNYTYKHMSTLKPLDKLISLLSTIVRDKS